MAEVTLREITTSNFEECIELSVREDQKEFVAPNVRSLAQAKVNPAFEPFAVYDRSVLGRDLGPDDRMIGFTMFEVTEGVGFIVRVMVGQVYQGKGYGKATVLEVIRQLKRRPDVEVIMTSHRHNNTVAGDLFRSVGYRENGIVEQGEVYLTLQE